MRCGYDDLREFAQYSVSIEADPKASGSLHGADREQRRQPGVRHFADERQRQMIIIGRHQTARGSQAQFRSDAGELGFGISVRPERKEQSHRNP